MAERQVSRIAAKNLARHRFFFFKPQSDRGAAAVEFALILPIFLLMLFFMLDAGRYLLVQMSLTSAAQNGARAIAYGADTSTTANLIRASVNKNIVQFSTLDNTSTTTSIATGIYVCPLNSEDVTAVDPLTGLVISKPDSTCTDLTQPANSAITCQTVLSNYRAKATASLTFKWITPINLVLQYLDPSLLGADSSILVNADRDAIPIVATGKTLCQK